MARPKPTCAFCGRKATKLCDYQVTMIISEVITCDTPLCSDCAVVIISLTTVPNYDTIDYCPIHKPPVFLPPGAPKPKDDFIAFPIHPRRQIEDKEEAIAKWREDHAATVARSRIEVI